ncbi:hypothetical protein M8J77_004872 [Diaphorina citri]|nr:hypothetical protein M8J77_004872 [Diaphorina citri]
MGHPVFRQILKAISLKRAIGLLEKREIWDVSTLISWISDHPPNQDSFFEVARHTAILLLLCSGRRVLDLTLLLSSRDGCQDLGDRAVFWPAFGSKTDTSGHRQSGWQLKQNPSNPLFDLLFWFKNKKEEVKKMKKRKKEAEEKKRNKQKEKKNKKTMKKTKKKKH